MSSYDGSRSARQSKRYSMSALYMSMSANEGEMQIEDDLAKGICIHSHLIFKLFLAFYLNSSSVSIPDGRFELLAYSDTDISKLRKCSETSKQKSLRNQKRISYLRKMCGI